MKKIICGLTTIIFIAIIASPVQGSKNDPFLKFARDFVFTAESGHTIVYSVTSDNLSFIAADGTLLASGKPFRSTTASVRQGFFHHGFSLLSDNQRIEHTLLIQTELKRVNNAGLIEPLDTKRFLSAHYWETDTEAREYLVTADIVDPLRSIRAIVVPKNRSCKTIFQ